MNETEPMNEARAREILGPFIREDNHLGSKGDEDLDWEPSYKDSGHMKGWFTADQLEAIAWWMRNKGGGADESIGCTSHSPESAVELALRTGPGQYGTCGM